MRGYDGSRSLGVLLAIVGALAFAGLLALSGAGQTAAPAPAVPLTSGGDGIVADSNEDFGATGDSGSTRIMSADTSRVVMEVVPLTDVTTDGPRDSIVIARDAPSPYGGDPPQPLDAPFGANVQADNIAGADSWASVAASGNDVYIAYEHPVGGGTDVRIAKSTNGGATWTILSLPAVGYNRMAPDIVLFPPNLVLVFIQHDDGAATNVYRYLVSTNGGASFATQGIQFPPSYPFTLFKRPGASGCTGSCVVATAGGVVVAAQAVYVGYEGWCAFTDGSCGSPAGAWQTVFLNDPTPSTGADWVIVIRSAGAPMGEEGFRPQMAANDGSEYLLIEFEQGNDVTWAAYLFTLDLINGNLDAVAIGPESDDPIFGSVAVLGQDITYGGAYHNAAAFGTPNHLMQVIHSAVGGGGGANWEFIQGGNGYFEAPNMEQKHLALTASGDVVHAAYRSVSDVVYWLSPTRGSTWTGPYRVSDNAGTVADVPHAVDLAYGAKIRIGWIDNRDGDNDAWHATLTGASMYVVKKNPASIGGTININTVAENVPYVALWNIGTVQNVDAPQTEPGPPDTQYNFVSWSDGGARAHDITVGAADTVLVANYQTQYWLSMSATVGGVTLTPGSSWQNAGATVTIECVMPAPSPDTRYTFGQWIGTGPGSITGPFNPVDIQMNGPITEICEATQQFRFQIDTSPTGLQVTINGTTLVAPQNNLWWDAGSSNTVTAISPQQPGGPLERYVFTQWADGPVAPTRTLVASAPGVYVAQYRLEYSVQIRPTPADCNYIVDGTTYVSGQTFWFVRDSIHALDVPSPQLRGPDTRYVFASWSDGQPRTHNIQVTVPLTLDLICTTEYRFQFDTLPTGFNLDVDGVSQPMPYTVWWAAGSNHQVQFQTININPDTRRAFVQWSDGNPNNPRSFNNVAAGANLVVQTAQEFRYQFNTNPSGLDLLIDSVTTTTPATVWWRETTSHTVQFQTISTPDTQTIFVDWSDGNANNPRTFTNVIGPGSFTANVVAQYRYILDTSPGGGQIRVDGIDCTAPCTFWWDFGSSHTAEFLTVPITADTRRAFADWSDGNTNNPRTFGNIQAPAQLTLRTQLEYRYVFDTSPTGLNLLVDGSPSTAPYTAWFAQGSSHSVEVPTPQTVGVGARRQFEQWSDGSSANPRTFSSINGPASLTATTYVEYELTFDTSPAGINVDVTVGTSTVTTPATIWVRAGSVQLDAPAPWPGGAGIRYAFVRWSDSATAPASRTVTVSAATTYTITYLRQYELAVFASPFSFTCDVADCWYEDGQVATIVLSAESFEVLPGGRVVFNGWTGGATGTWQSSQITMDSSKTVFVVLKAQVLLTVQVVDQNGAALPGATIQVTVNNTAVPYDSAKGGYWVDLGSTATVNVPDEFTSGGQTYKFVTWVNGQASRTLSVTPSLPATVAAQFRPVSLFESPVLWVGLIVAIVAAILLAWFLLRRRKQQPEEMPPGPAAAPPAPPAPSAGVPPPPMAAAPAEATMACPSCGLTIPAKAGPCPICGAEVAPPPAPAGDERIARLEEAYKSGRISYEQYQANLKRIRGAS